MSLLPQTESIKCALEVASKSIAGARPDNQDSLTHFESPFGHLFVLADGMGGYGGGSIASSLATSQIPAYLSSLPTTRQPQSALSDAIQDVNRSILERSRAGGQAVEGMGCTLATLLVRDTQDGLLAIGAHVGDSRIYFLRGAQMFRLTQDHTVVEKLVESGVLTPEQAFDHPQASVLTRALGREGKLAIDFTSWILLQPGDTFLLCSDGLSGFVGDEAIHRVLIREDAAEATTDELIDLAVCEKSDDNISVLFARVVAIPSPPGSQSGR